MSNVDTGSCVVSSEELTRQENECPHLDETSTLLNLIGKSYTNEILRELTLDPEPLRFNELEKRLDLSPDTLSSRLTELQEAELVTRRSYDEIPPRVEYEATSKVRELGPMYDILGEWVKRHDW